MATAANELRRTVATGQGAFGADYDVPGAIHVGGADRTDIFLAVVDRAGNQSTTHGLLGLQGQTLLFIGPRWRDQVGLTFQDDEHLRFFR